MEKESLKKMVTKQVNKNSKKKNFFFFYWIEKVRKKKVTNKERKINEKINCTYNTVIVLIVAEGKKFPQFSAPNCSAKPFFFL